MCGKCKYFNNGKCKYKIKYPVSAYAYDNGYRKKVNKKEGKNCLCFESKSEELPFLPPRHHKRSNKKIVYVLMQGF